MRRWREQGTQITSVSLLSLQPVVVFFSWLAWVGPVTMKKKRKKIHVLDSDLETKQQPLQNQTDFFFFFLFLSFCFRRHRKFFFVQKNLKPTFWTRSFHRSGSVLGSKPRQVVPQIKDLLDTGLSLSTSSPSEDLPSRCVPTSSGSRTVWLSTLCNTFMDSIGKLNVRSRSHDSDHNLSLLRCRLRNQPWLIMHLALSHS